jgi:hypothetical protein
MRSRDEDERLGDDRDLEVDDHVELVAVGLLEWVDAEFGLEERRLDDYDEEAASVHESSVNALPKRWIRFRRLTRWSGQLGIGHKRRLGKRSRPNPTDLARWTGARGLSSVRPVSLVVPNPKDQNSTHQLIAS